MSAHLIIQGPDTIDGLQLTVDTVPRVNELIAYSGMTFRVHKIVHLLTMNTVRVEVVEERTWSRA